MLRDPVATKEHFQIVSAWVSSDLYDRFGVIFSYLAPLVSPLLSFRAWGSSTNEVNKTLGLLTPSHHSYKHATYQYHGLLFIADVTSEWTPPFAAPGAILREGRGLPRRSR